MSAHVFPKVIPETGTSPHPAPCPVQMRWHQIAPGPARGPDLTPRSWHGLCCLFTQSSSPLRSGCSAFAHWSQEPFIYRLLERCFFSAPGFTDLTGVLQVWGLHLLGLGSVKALGPVTAFPEFCCVMFLSDLFPVKLPLWTCVLGWGLAAGCLLTNVEWACWTPGLSPAPLTDSPPLETGVDVQSATSPSSLPGWVCVHVGHFLCFSFYFKKGYASCLELERELTLADSSPYDMNLVLKIFRGLWRVGVWELVGGKESWTGTDPMS